MILTHGANSIARGGSGGNVVTIGGRDYPCVKIGSLLWITENLDWKFDGLSISNQFSSGNKACYYNNSESTYGVDGNKYGLLYNLEAAMYINDNNMLPSGWRVPTETDILSLISSAGNSVLEQLTNLATETGWNYLTGSNALGFSMPPAGYLDVGPVFRALGNSTYLHTSTKVSNNRGYVFEFSKFSSSERIERGAQSYLSYGSIRLCKDVL